MDRVGSQARGIVAVGITAGDAEEPLAQQVSNRMLDLAGLPTIGQAGGQPPAQLQRRIASLEQDRPAIGAAVPLIKAHQQRLGI